MKELGERLYKLQSEAIRFKSILNEAKLALGIALNQLKDIYDEGEFEGMYELDPDDTTFNHFLAELHTNKRRTYQMMSNSNYVLDMEIPPEKYSLLDSSLIDLCRRNNLNPLDYIELSYSDVLSLTKKTTNE